MKNFLTKNNYILIAVIMAVVITAFFLVVRFTALSVTAYIIALIGIALLYFGFLYMLKSPRSYPWFAAFPMRILQYMVSQLAVSAVVLLAENLFDWSLSLQWFLFVHIILLGVCLITLIMLKVGKEVIEKREDVVREKAAALRLMQTDAESLIRKFPEHEKSLKAVWEALRYSDPMSHPSLAPFEEQIQRSLAALSEDQVKIPERCEQILLQIADRNSRVKAMKG